MGTHMYEASPMDEVTDLIASVEMHRKEIERESGLEASRIAIVIKARESGDGNGQRAERGAIAHVERTRLRRQEMRVQWRGPCGERDAGGSECSAHGHDYSVPFTHRCTYGYVAVM